jgi:predicted methyltransferase
MKTNKHKTLLLAKNQRTLDSHDLVRKFAYSPGTARSYLSHLGWQGLLKRENRKYSLTEKGHSRLRYFAIFGCPHPMCPLCKGKMGNLTCPNCENRIPREKARILKQRNYLLVVRQAGVYCHFCLAMILDEVHAIRLRIRPEE